ncbi:MAG TPA: glycerate kinase [Thermoflexia bacterium]|nr:glycerate kinase [Thermoflexia bacterium]
MLRDALKEIREAALRAVDPAAAVRRHLQIIEGELHVAGESWSLAALERIWLLSAGKAAAPMAAAAGELLEPYLKAGLVVTKYAHATGATLPARVQVIEAGHPVPDEAGHRGAAAMLELLAESASRDLVLVLLSGGGSALLPLPVPGVTLPELQATTELLLRSGATIAELNAVRKHLSRLKGGQLARAAAPAPLVALILSDVVGDPLDVIASGPTVPDPTTYADAWAVLGRYDLRSEVPATVSAHLRAGLAGERPETPKPGAALFEQVYNQLIGSNRQAALAAVETARRLGYPTLLLTTFMEGEAREVARVAAALAKGLRRHGDPLKPPACLVWGGETTVTVRGAGKGGRNQELALAAAQALAGWEEIAIMALATDGTDGPTDAAGAVIDGSTVRRARELGLKPQAALDQNDAYPLLAATGDLLRLGPTGTNVNDLLVILVGPETPTAKSAERNQNFTIEA